MTASHKLPIIRLVLVGLAICLLALIPLSTALASSHMKTGGQMEMDKDDDSGGDSAMGGMPAGGMQMGVTDTWQDQVNRVSYPTTAVVALLAVWVCVLLMKATGMVDKFGLISIALGLFFVQAIVGVVFYLSNGDLVTMPTLMFIMSLSTSLALLLIGGAFYRWKRMIR